MHVLITGAAGMIGRKLTERLITDGSLMSHPVEKLTLLDVVAPARPAGFSDHVKTRAADLAEPGVAEKAISELGVGEALVSLLQPDGAPAARPTHPRWCSASAAGPARPARRSAAPPARPRPPS